jgi:hypothetical protein
LQELSKPAIKELPKRLLYLAFGVATFLILYSVGAALPLTHEDAEAIANDFMAQAQGIDQAGIFLNNIKIALGMFVPGFGVGLGAYSALGTGMTFNALVTMNPALQGLNPLTVLATPYGAIEVLAYGLAISRSGLLVIQLIKQRPLWRRFVKFTVVELAIVITALLAGAAIENQMINS